MKINSEIIFPKTSQRMKKVTKNYACVEEVKEEENVKIKYYEEYLEEVNKLEDGVKIEYEKYLDEVKQEENVKIEYMEEDKQEEDLKRVYEYDDPAEDSYEEDIDEYQDGACSDEFNSPYSRPRYKSTHTQNENKSPKEETTKGRYKSLYKIMFQLPYYNCKNCFEKLTDFKRFKRLNISQMTSLLHTLASGSL